MSELKKTDPAVPAAVQPGKPIPQNLPEELLPVFDWWHAQGKKTVYLAAIALAVVGLAFIYTNNQKSKSRQASERLLAADSVEELEALVSQYGRTGAGTLAQLRLAKAYFDAGRYDDALARYDAFSGKSAKRFADIAVLGRAHVLEAKGEINEARTVYAAFRQEKPDHFLTPQALMGEARCLAIAGNRDAATELLDVLIAAKAGTPWEDVAENLKDVVTRYEKRAPVSLFDQADSLLPELTPAPTTPADQAEVPAAETN